MPSSSDKSTKTDFPEGKKKKNKFRMFQFGSRKGNEVDSSNRNKRTELSNGIYDVKCTSSGDCGKGSDGFEILPNNSANTRQYSADHPDVAASYNAIPNIEVTNLPRGGISMDTAAVGRVQFGIPPETIKDSMQLGLNVPCLYIVPIERFCREMGAALGVNLAEFEFPAYFNFFVQRKKCRLLVDSLDAEQNIRRVFNETLLGPAQFRRPDNPIEYEEEDFDPEFPREAIPNFYKEFKHFRMTPSGDELVLETLLNFSHFEIPKYNETHENLGVPPPRKNKSEVVEKKEDTVDVDDSDTGCLAMHLSENSEEPITIGGDKRRHMSFDNIGADSMSSLAASLDLGTEGDNEPPQREELTYAHVKWMGDVATVWQNDATAEQIASRSCKRVEIFKMPGATDYILHDIDENNFIVGKVKFSGHVRVPDHLSVTGFNNVDDDESSSVVTNTSEDIFEAKLSIENELPPTFHPPSFGVTVLGNSHGFDKSGSTSGYVLWINGRGVMIDPPPYSSATLEREGIRQRTIVGIILTHCHADHDAGAFQKVLTGSPVVVITTPTIYKSFIRKYAALSEFNTALLKHSHRYKPAIIGQPLRFQGATFEFTYTLHSIPCVGFRVVWRGRSMVFTGDHFNNPPVLEKFSEQGILSKARMDDLNNFPLQDCDLLLHESGVPPLHTPLDVLLKLPAEVKKRMYIVHTSALPVGCELKVAPTGTAGTIRLDGLDNYGKPDAQQEWERGNTKKSLMRLNSTQQSSLSVMDTFEYSNHNRGASLGSSGGKSLEINLSREENLPPLVCLRPMSSSDSWFSLNLLSAVPFLSSLSYSSTMEVLETARVDTFCVNDVVVPAKRRREILCVVWEGTCMEREFVDDNVTFVPKQKMIKSRMMSVHHPSLGKHGPYVKGSRGKNRKGAVWHAGDWTGPIALQPDKRLSGESALSKTHDIVAMSSQGVKVITIEFAKLHNILKRSNGSSLYRKYLARKLDQGTNESNSENDVDKKSSPLHVEAVRSLNIIELLESNSALRKLSAVQKRHLESLAEGPVTIPPGKRLWQVGSPVDKSFMIVGGTVSFVQKRRNAPPYSYSHDGQDQPSILHTPNRFLSDVDDSLRKSCASEDREGMVHDIRRAIKELGETVNDDNASESSLSTYDSHPKSGKSSLTGKKSLKDGRNATDSTEFSRLEVSLRKKAVGKKILKKKKQVYNKDNVSNELLQEGNFLSEEVRLLGVGDAHLTQKRAVARRRSSKDRYANKVLGRLYSRRAFTAGLVFSRGHFLGDVSKMMTVSLGGGSSGSDEYGFGDKDEGASGDYINETAPESDGDILVLHTSTLAAGKDGCVVIVFPKASLIPFLDEYPGILLSLLGTQVVV